MSTKIRVVNVLKKKFIPLPASRYSKSTKRSTQPRHQANEGKSGLEAKRIRALGALRRLTFQTKLAAEKGREMLFLRNEEKKKWIEDYVKRESAGATKRVEDAEAAVQQEQHDMPHAEIAGLTSKEAETRNVQMLVAIGDSPSDLVSSENGEDGEGQDDEEIEQGNLSEDDEPGWVMGAITRPVQQSMERFWHKQMMVDELTQPGWEDAADYCPERDKRYGTTELRVLAVVQPQTNHDAPAPLPPTFAELMESLDIVPGISQRMQGTSRPGSSHIRLGLVMLHSKSSIPSGELAAKPDSSMLLKAKPIEPVSFYPCI